MDRFVRQNDSNPLKLTKSRSTGYETILGGNCGRRHYRCCGMRKKDQTRYHVTTKSTTGYNMMS